MSPIFTPFRTRLLVASLALGAALPCVAQDRPFHVELGAGWASVDEVEGVPVDDSTTAFRLGTGYAFSDWFGVSGSFVDLGTIEATFDSGGGSPLPIKASADGFDLMLNGRIPIGESFALTAQAGVLWWTADSTVGTTVDKDSGNDVTWGVGGEYAFNPAFAVTASWRRYTVENVDIESAWLGVVFRFGDNP